ncbi:serine/threonine-protein kinase [Yimella sp. cx-51]|uniref:serine/threonine-protein kinase n=1 Tax=Yimella sp. cx-51 TaxID=2770551 RepID=UPI00165E9626|nr:serine/threonine-protein kinase [Yimella sp. cx-51]MBC9958148.1 serine/threonine protein kinase [Yimella sp. cx-51]QTH38815.1 serine/threonine protein kinase [Yimella sp. cx-51]
MSWRSTVSDDSHRVRVLLVGEVFAGRYELIDMIGEGGMGGVWRAYDLRDGSVIAAKVLRQSDAGSLLRFMREQGMRIHHPNVVTPMGWAGADDRVLLTMPLVDGGSLSGLAGKHGKFAAPYAAELLRQLLSALQAVHDQRIVHRDVKPANMLMSSTGTDKPHLWLTDFGVAVSQDAPRLTSHSIVMGTPGYLAPEQLMGHDPDPRSDLYAVGMMGIQLITGHKPRAQVRTDAADLPPRPDDVPDALWHTVVRMADPDIEKRPHSAQEALDALAAVPWQKQKTVDIRSELPPLGESSGEFAPGGRTMAFDGGRTQTRQQTAALGFTPADTANRAVARAGRARRMQRLAVLVGAPLVALAALGAIWLTGDSGPSGTPGLSRLGAECRWSDVGTTEPDQNGVERVCQLDGGRYVWSKV